MFRRHHPIGRGAGAAGMVNWTPMDDRTEHADRLVDFFCVRETHQRSGTDAVISVESGALLLCPSGETLGHVWRGAVGSPSPDDRRLRGVIAARGHLAAIPVLRAN